MNSPSSNYHRIRFFGPFAWAEKDRTNTFWVGASDASYRHVIGKLWLRK